MGGNVGELLNTTESPPDFAHVLLAFRDLSGSDITFQEVLAYKEATGTTLNYLDIELIKDIKFIQTMAQHGRSKDDMRGAFKWLN